MEQREYEEARRLHQQSLDIKERLGDERGRASSLLGLGESAYKQGKFENALTYMIHAYILFDTLQSPYRALAQSVITRLRNQMDEETFTTQWRTLAGDRPLVAAMEQGEAQNTVAVTIEQLPGFVSSVIMRGMAEQCQQLAISLIKAQQQLSPETAPLGRFLGCLVAVLRGETPKVILLEAPFTELWQEFQDALNVQSNEADR